MKTLRQMVMEKFGTAQAMVEANQDVGSPQQVKVAASPANRLAETVDQIAGYLSKYAEESSAGPGKGPGALGFQAQPSAGGPFMTGTPAKNSDDKVPLESGTEDSTAVETDYTDPPGAGPGMQLPDKVASLVTRVRKILKQAQEESSGGPGKGPGVIDNTLSQKSPPIPDGGQVLQDTQKVIDLKASDAQDIVQDQITGVLDEKPVAAADTPLAKDTFDSAKQSSAQPRNRQAAQKSAEVLMTAMKVAESCPAELAPAIRHLAGRELLKAAAEEEKKRMGVVGRRTLKGMGIGAAVGAPLGLANILAMRRLTGAPLSLAIPAGLMGGAIGGAPWGAGIGALSGALSKEREVEKAYRLRKAVEDLNKVAAAARVFLQKLADKGCTCGGAGECDFCRMNALVNNPGSAGAAIKH